MCTSTQCKRLHFRLFLLSEFSRSLCNARAERLRINTLPVFDLLTPDDPLVRSYCYLCGYHNLTMA